jgi:hypothetical protein
MTSADTKPKSYTQRMLDVLETNKCPTKYIDLIKKFAADESEKREEQTQATKDVMTWGKYKNKKIEEVFKLDPQYINWCIKNGQYLSQPQKDLMNSLINSE